MNVQKHGRLIADQSPRRPDFNSRLIHVRFAVDEVALGQTFLVYLGYFFLPVSFH
jgi:hypothetical protein